MVDWLADRDINIELHNMGDGLALNIHCVLYGSITALNNQYASWDNGPFTGKSSELVEFVHPKMSGLQSQELLLYRNERIDDVHPLYDNALDSIACLTVTYHDIFGNKYVSIFNHTLEAPFKHRWVCVAISKIPSLNGKAPLDLKELNDRKKQKATKPQTL